MKETNAIEQVKRLSNAIEKYDIVATSNESSDDKIANLCSKNDIKIYKVLYHMLYKDLLNALNILIWIIFSESEEMIL